MSLARKRIAILGLGLMGGSLALALRGKCAALLGIDPDPRVIQFALERRIVDRGAAHPAELLSQADLIVLAAPVRAILNILRSLPDLHPNPAMVLDLGSTKVEIAAALAGLPERFEAVAGHPFCGKETSSIEHAEARLYQSAPFVLVELPNSTPRACELALELVEAIGAQPLWLDAETHDRWGSVGRARLPQRQSPGAFFTADDGGYLKHQPPECPRQPGGSQKPPGSLGARPGGPG